MSAVTGSGKELADLIYQLRCKCVDKHESIREDIRLSPAEYRAINSINPGDVLSGAGFAEKIGLSPSRTSRVIDKMLKHKYLKVLQNSEDRRGISVMLDKKGCELKHNLNKELTSCNEIIENSLSVEERISISKTLTRLIEIL